MWQNLCPVQLEFVKAWKKSWNMLQHSSIYSQINWPIFFVPNVFPKLVLLLLCPMSGTWPWSSCSCPRRPPCSPCRRRREQGCCTPWAKRERSIVVPGVLNLWVATQKWIAIRQSCCFKVEKKEEEEWETFWCPDRMFFPLRIAPNQFPLSIDKKWVFAWFLISRLHWSDDDMWILRSCWKSNGHTLKHQVCKNDMLFSRNLAHGQSWQLWFICRTWSWSSAPSRRWRCSRTTPSTCPTCRRSLQKKNKNKNSKNNSRTRALTGGGRTSFFFTTVDLGHQHGQGQEDQHLAIHHFFFGVGGKHARWYPELPFRRSGSDFYICSKGITEHVWFLPIVVSIFFALLNSLLLWSGWSKKRKRFAQIQRWASPVPKKKLSGEKGMIKFFLVVVGGGGGKWDWNWV